MLERLKKEVCDANFDLVDKGVVIYTWGNVSGISEDRKYMVIKGRYQISLLTIIIILISGLL